MYYLLEQEEQFYLEEQCYQVHHNDQQYQYFQKGFEDRKDRTKSTSKTRFTWKTSLNSGNNVTGRPIYPKSSLRTRGTNKISRTLSTW
ncbi:hypothetical protein CHS0354_011961 [Potamilus streckersoni]|uniref:Uncharacterized protein n=1 Tax=Potamilus streckersoni TaxID=2493646 RepID=A0AAE0TFI4_9BIVA|nr:hypothetical protein CHS0354_011961 [Potamilus streckersoni]